MIAVSFCLKGRLPALVGPTAPAHHVLGLQEPSSVKDSLQALGIPHTEIDLLLVGGLPVSFGYRVRDGDRIEVHPPPAAAAGDETECSWPDSRLQPRPLAWERFVCDSHLGRLARLLRLLGFDTLYRNDWREPALAAAAARETRALLTCSRGLLMRRDVGRGMLILSRQADEQAREVLARFGLAARARPFARCSLCNGDLRPVPKRDVLLRIPLRTRAWCDDYRQCRGCGQLYWEGTHVQRLRARLSALVQGP